MSASKQDDRQILLNSIQTGTVLKKTDTNDRSSPNISSAPRGSGAAVDRQKPEPPPNIPLLPRGSGAAVDGPNIKLSQRPPPPLPPRSANPPSEDVVAQWFFPVNFPPPRPFSTHRAKTRTYRSKAEYSNSVQTQANNSSDTLGRIDSMIASLDAVLKTYIQAEEYEKCAKSKSQIHKLETLKKRAQSGMDVEAELDRLDH